MPNSLDPSGRVLYGTSLQAPPGFVFDAGLATTYTLDLEMALVAPVSLALYAAENRDEILTNRIALLEGIERVADRLLIFADADRILAQRSQHSRLCSLLERIVVEVAAPGGGAFHPKMWAIRFKPSAGDGPSRMRLLVLSRNLTRDRSWDIALTLDGEVDDAPRPQNDPLAHFARRLPELALAEQPEDARALASGLAEDIRRANWNLPEGFDDLSFAANGIGGDVDFPWQPERCSRMGVISPFCSNSTLSTLADLSREEPVLIGRSDELATIPLATLARFARVAVLDESAASEDGEEVDQTGLHGLHAKAFIAENGGRTWLTVGSGNATSAALEGRNTELFATLTGTVSKVGGVEDILGDDGFGRLTKEFDPDDSVDADSAARRAAEDRFDEARRTLCRSGLLLRCAREAEGDGEVWRCLLIPPSSLPLPGVASLRVWPITRGEAHARDALEELQGGEAVDLGDMPLIDLTRFLACEITDEESGLTSLFTAGLVLEGLPAERHAAILRSIIENKDSFFRYLRLLLAEVGDPFAAMLAMQDGEGGGGGWSGLGGDDGAVLEDLVRAYCSGGDTLDRVERMISRFEARGADAADPIPEDFRALWETFRDVLKKRERKREGTRERTHAA